MMEKTTTISDEVLFESCKGAIDECLKELFRVRAMNLTTISEYEKELDAFIVERGNFWKDKFSGMTKKDAMDYCIGELIHMVRGVRKDD